MKMNKTKIVLDKGEDIIILWVTIFMNNGSGGSMKLKRDMTKSELADLKWKESGRPRLVWNSAKNGTLIGQLPKSKFEAKTLREPLFGKPHRERVV